MSSVCFMGGVYLGRLFCLVGLGFVIRNGFESLEYRGYRVLRLGSRV